MIKIGFLACSLILAGTMSAGAIIICDQQGCRSEGVVPAPDAAGATRDHLINNLAPVDRTAVDASKNYFDLVFSDSCDASSRLQQIALSFVKAKPRSFWERLRSIGVADSNKFTLNIEVSQLVTAGAKLLGESSVVSYALNQDGTVQAIDCDARLASKINANADLRVTFKFYIGRTPEANRQTVAGLRVAAKIGTFLISNGLISDMFSRPAGILTSAADTQVSIGQTFFDQFKEVEELRVSRSLVRAQGGLTLQRRPFLKKVYTDSAWAEIQADGQMFRPNQDIGQAMKAQTDVELLPIVAEKVPDYVAGLNETAESGRRTCSQLKRTVSGFANLLDQDIALYYVLKSNSDLLEGKAKYHCFDRAAVERLRGVGLTAEPYELAYSRGPATRVAGGR